MSTAHTPKLRFFSNPRSRARMVHWMLQECGADYEIVNLEFGPEMKTPEFLAINPMGKVPALQHGDAVITETGAILAYLAELFPDKQLAPAIASPQRAARQLFSLAVLCCRSGRGRHHGQKRRLAEVANPSASHVGRLWPL